VDLVEEEDRARAARAEPLPRRASTSRTSSPSPTRPTAPRTRRRSTRRRSAPASSSRSRRPVEDRGVDAILLDRAP
jgi:hypothetical protein